MERFVFVPFLQRPAGTGPEAAAGVSCSRCLPTGDHKDGSVAVSTAALQCLDVSYHF